MEILSEVEVLEIEVKVKDFFFFESVLKVCYLRLDDFSVLYVDVDQFYPQIVP